MVCFIIYVGLKYTHAKKGEYEKTRDREKERKSVRLSLRLAVVLYPISCRQLAARIRHVACHLLSCKGVAWAASCLLAHTHKHTSAADGSVCFPFHLYLGADTICAQTINLKLNSPVGQLIATFCLWQFLKTDKSVVRSQCILCWTAGQGHATFCSKWQIAVCLVLQVRLWIVTIVSLSLGLSGSTEFELESGRRWTQLQLMAISTRTHNESA